MYGIFHFFLHQCRRKLPKSFEDIEEKGNFVGQKP